MNYTLSKLLGGTLMSVVIAGNAHAVTSIRVEFTSGGQVGFAPLFGAFHNGSYDTFNAGSAASANLETLAESGGPGGLVTDASNAGADSMPVFGNNPSPPIFTPGGSNSAVFTVADGNGMFSYAAMILPSNDWFVGNDSAFDASSLLGASIGTSLNIGITTFWDAGTELEDFAFSPGNGLLGVTAAGTDAADAGADQNGVISLVTATNPFSTFLNADGFDSMGADENTFAFSGNLATITLTVVPEPSTSLLGILAGASMLLRRRRK